MFERKNPRAALSSVMLKSGVEMGLGVVFLLCLNVNLGFCFSN